MFANNQEKQPFLWMFVFIPTITFFCLFICMFVCCSILLFIQIDNKSINYIQNQKTEKIQTVAGKKSIIQNKMALVEVSDTLKSV